MKTNQNGFSAVEVIIVLVVVGILGFGGWYVWQSKDKDDKKNTSSQQNGGDSDDSQVDPYADWQTYSKGDLTFKYPSDWGLTEIGPGPQLKSGDYASTGLQRTTVTKGASIGVTNPTDPQTTVTAANFKTSALWSPSNSNFKTVTINGKQAAQYNLDTDIVNTVIFGTKGEMVNLQFQFVSDDHEATQAIYDYILETVEIK